MIHLILLLKDFDPFHDHPGYFYGAHWTLWLFLTGVSLIFLVYFLIYLWYRLGTTKEQRQNIMKQTGYQPRRIMPWWAWLIIFAFTYFLISHLTIWDFLIKK